MSEKYYFTSESVTEGHPDKVCDQIADAVLDDILTHDKAARVACEVIATTGMVLVMGEISTKHYCDIPNIVKKTLKNIGYTSGLGFDADKCAVLSSIKEQSADIALGVDNSLEFKGGGELYDKIGAGDQGMMFGFACDETPEYMPYAIMAAHKLAFRLTEARKYKEIAGLRPDGKTQVTAEYEDGVLKRVDTIVVSAQHEPQVEMDVLTREITEKVIKKVIEPKYLDKNTKILINPTGRFEIGGPESDSGLTGRKIIVDTYGGYCAHGGGAFSGKDPTKVDRSAAYMARYICKNIVAAGLAKKCELQVSYAIGVAHPLSLHVNTYGTGKLTDAELAKIVGKTFDLRPRAIIDKFDLCSPIYSATSAYGHFGKPGLAWEKLDSVEILKKRLK